MSEEEKKIVNETKQLIEDIVILSGGVRDFTYGNMNIRISTVDTLIKILEKLQKEKETYRNDIYGTRLVLKERDKEIEELKRQIQIKNNYIKLILDILYDYDGYFSRQTNEGSAKDLADLIDETCDYLKKAILNDDKSDVYKSYVDDEQHLT